MTSIHDRSEILFIYEVKDANPNGDPRDENKPRTDADTGQALVSDVRIKRTIRDYWHNRLGLEILIRDTTTPEGYLKEGKARAADFAADIPDDEKKSIGTFERALSREILKQCIDARAFGCTLPVSVNRKDGSITLTGPTQFIGFSRSLHAVTVQFIQGTAAFAGGAERTRKSFREEYRVPYACIATYGVINEVAARSTGMTAEDRDLLIQGLWRGTQDLITRSKMGHHPLALLDIRYASGHRLGDLNGRATMQSDLDDREIRSVEDYQVELGQLLDGLADMGDKVKSIRVASDSRLRCLWHSKEVALEGLTVGNRAVEHLDLGV